MATQHIDTERNETMTTTKIAVILLAAGGSRRLGKAKQMLSYRDQPLLVCAAEQALSLDLSVYVILGKNPVQLGQQLTPLPVKTIINPIWQQGISSSIQCGLQHINDSVDGTLFMLCDQPFIPLTHYQALLRLAVENPQKIIATQYPLGHSGVPAVIPHRFFSELLQLSGDKGAQKIIKQHANDVISLFCQEAAWDIDTAEQAKWLTAGPPTI